MKFTIRCLGQFCACKCSLFVICVVRVIACFWPLSLEISISQIEPAIGSKILKCMGKDRKKSEREKKKKDLGFRRVSGAWPGRL